MIIFELGVDDLADTRFGLSPLAETLFSLRALAEPRRNALYIPWRRSVLAQLPALNSSLLMSLLGPSRVRPGFRTPSRALPDFLTPRPETFAPTFEEQLATARATTAAVVRRDLLGTHAPDALPGPLQGVNEPDDEPVLALLQTVCDLLQGYWDVAMRPVWPQMRLVMEADMIYRARQLATGGARLLFADIHPNLRWSDGTLIIEEMISSHRVAAAGRGLLLIPSVFAYKPAPPVNPDEPPSLFYPSRGVGTLWTAPPEIDATALTSLIGGPRARLLHLLAEPLPTVEIARRLKVTPSAVSQHLQVLHATGLVSRSRDARYVLYRRSALGDELIGRPAGTDAE